MTGDFIRKYIQIQRIKKVSLLFSPKNSETFLNVSKCALFIRKNRNFRRKKVEKVVKFFENLRNVHFYLKN